MPIDSQLHNLLDPLPNKPIHKLNKKQMAYFQTLIGWESGPVAPFPLAGERNVRRKREAWKRRRAGKGRPDPCLLYKPENIACLKRNARSHRPTHRWLDRLLVIANEVSSLPLETFTQLIEGLGPWNCSGVYCPNCVGDKSPQSIHNRFWTWNVRDMDRISCPYCGITYPHADFPEEGTIKLPRLGHEYRFYLGPKEKENPNWRLGEDALQYAGFPVHVSLSGEIRSTKLDWALGQVEPLCIAFALTRRKRYARTAEAILLRLAEVYPEYPLISYNHDYVDAEPGYATENAEKIPTLFKKNAFLPAYTGILGDNDNLFGQAQTTTHFTRVASGAWGCTRLAREKSATGQLFLSLFRGYDLIKSTLSPENRIKIERDFLLEQYLDVKALSWRVDNKTGPGTTARVAVGVFYDDPVELDEGLDYFHRVIDSQYYQDGSPKEAPVYAAKPVYENLWETPEILRGHTDLYGESTYTQGLQMFANIATPLGTQPPIDDTSATSRLPPTIVDIARLRTGVNLGYGTSNFSAFNLSDPKPKTGSSFYVVSPAQLPASSDRGFHPVGFLSLPYPRQSAFSMFNEPLPRSAGRRSTSATNCCYADRGLACLGFGRGKSATQLYFIGEDGRSGHRHSGPLSILLFSQGQEIFPDLGYIADHPANKWIKSTPAHNTVTVDESNCRAAGPSKVNALVTEGTIRFADITVPIEGMDLYRRAVTLIRKSDGLPLLVDIFDIAGGSVHDYQVRVNDPDQVFTIPDNPLKNRRKPLYTDLSSFPIWNFRTGGRAASPFTATWGKGLKVKATVLTPCTEVITYPTPAWRDYREVFAAPDKSFDTLVLRNRRKRSRYVVVYELYRGNPLLQEISANNIQPAVNLFLRENKGRSYELVIGEGEIRAEIKR
jgi:hypothetical protein